MPDMPPRVAAAHKATTGTGRLLVLRFLLANPNASRVEVAEGSGAGAKSAWVAIRELEELGYVQTAPDTSAAGRTIHRYSVDRELLSADMAAFVSWVLDPR
jgi:hypothetical protein